MRTFRADGRVIALWGIGLAAATVMAVPFGLAVVAGNVEVPGLAVLWLIGLAAAWLGALTTAIEVVVEPDGLVTCRGVLRTVRFRAGDVVEVRGWIWWNPFLVTIVHRGGRVWVIGRMNGFADLVAEFRRANPSVVLKGV